MIQASLDSELALHYEHSPGNITGELMRNYNLSYY